MVARWHLARAISSINVSVVFLSFSKQHRCIILCIAFSLSVTGVSSHFFFQRNNKLCLASGFEAPFPGISRNRSVDFERMSESVSLLVDHAYSRSFSAVGSASRSDLISSALFLFLETHSTLTRNSFSISSSSANNSSSRAAGHISKLMAPHVTKFLKRRTNYGKVRAQVSGNELIAEVPVTAGYTGASFH